MPEIKQYLEAEIRLGRVQNNAIFDFKMAFIVKKAH